MVKRIVKIIAVFLLLISGVIIHLGIAYMLPYPWNSINILFVCSILFLVFRGSGLVVWLTCSMHFIIELYSIQPFGITLTASTFSLLFTYWLYKFVFTNRSWYAVIALCITALLFYRIIATTLLWLFAIFVYDINLPMQSLMIQYGWEMLFTTLIASSIYMVPYLLQSKQKQPQKALFL